jgi:hypothetical protein
MVVECVYRVVYRGWIGRLVDLRLRGWRDGRCLPFDVDEIGEALGGGCAHARQ